MNSQSIYKDEEGHEYFPIKIQCKCYECRTGEDICEACEDFGHQEDDFQP